ncbi:MAG: hypothetical protein HY649_12385 [Acidobacteria bacterium]|nr:hypothetical protein [Acidobacteriota bacterium]
MAHPQIAAFARMAKGGEAPNRLIYGQATKLSRTMHDIRYNEKRDEIHVPNPFAQSLLTFRGDADGQQAPIRIIQGPKTRLQKPDTLEIDVVHNEIIVPQGEEVLVFPLTGNGNVAPIRILQGGLEMGWRSGPGVAVDPVHNVLVTDGSIVDQTPPSASATPYRRSYTRGRDSILIFDRTANGKIKPLRVIRGPKTGIKAIRQMQIYPEKGWIIIAQITDGGNPEPEGTFVGVWSIYDNGDVAPRWKIEGKPGNVMKKPRGVALNPNHKELLVSDMRLNAVLTYYFPEIF